MRQLLCRKDRACTCAARRGRSPARRPRFSWWRKISLGNGIEKGSGEILCSRWQTRVIGSSSRSHAPLDYDGLAPILADALGTCPPPFTAPRWQPERPPRAPRRPQHGSLSQQPTLPFRCTRSEIGAPYPGSLMAQVASVWVRHARRCRLFRSSRNNAFGSSRLVHFGKGRSDVSTDQSKRLAPGINFLPAKTGA